MYKVYRLYAADGQLLYVGCTRNYEARIRQHQRNSPWFAKVEKFVVSNPLSGDDARAIEGAAIANEGPKFNLNGRRVLTPAQEYKKMLEEFSRRRTRAENLRAAGETWTSIGALLGVSRQRAQQIVQGNKPKARRNGAKE